MKNFRELVNEVVAEFDDTLLRSNTLVDAVVLKLADATVEIDLPSIKIAVKDMDDLFYSLEQKMDTFTVQRGTTSDHNRALAHARTEFRRIQSEMAAWRYKVHSHELLPSHKPSQSLDEIQTTLKEIMNGKKPKREKAKAKTKKKKAPALPKLSKFEIAKFLIVLGETMKKHRIGLKTAITNQWSSNAYGDFENRMREFGISETRIPQVYKLGVLLFDDGNEGW